MTSLRHFAGAAAGTASPLLMMTIFLLHLGQRLAYLCPPVPAGCARIISMTAASLYCLKDSAFKFIALAVAAPWASISRKPSQTSAGLVGIGLGRQTAASVDVRGSEALGFGGGGIAGRFGFELKLSGVGQGFHAVSVRRPPPFARWPPTRAVCAGIPAAATRSASVSR